MHMCAESLPCSLVSITQLLISYIPIQNKAFINKKKKEEGIEAGHRWDPD